MALRSSLEVLGRGVVDVVRYVVVYVVVVIVAVAVSSTSSFVG